MVVSKLKLRRVIFISAILFLLLYISGILSPPTIEYRIYIELPKDTDHIKDIIIYLPYPHYCIFPLPYYKGSPINRIYEVLKIAANARNSHLKVIKVKKYGRMLKITLPKLSNYDKGIPTNELKLEFKKVNSGYFITPAYFFRRLDNIFFLCPVKEKLIWRSYQKKNKQKGKDEKVYLATHEVKTIIYTNEAAKRVDIEVIFKVKKRILLREIILTEKIQDKACIRKPNWHKVKINRSYHKRWLP